MLNHLYGVFFFFNLSAKLFKMWGIQTNFFFLALSMHAVRKECLSRHIIGPKRDFDYYFFFSAFTSDSSQKFKNHWCCGRSPYC